MLNPDQLHITPLQRAKASTYITGALGEITILGEVDPEAAQAIDPHIQHLALIAFKLASLFEKHSSTPASPDAENHTEL